MKKTYKENNTLSIRNLHVTIERNPIVAGVSIAIRPGEIHLLMGPNGSGKSTLLNALAGHPRCNVQSGSIVLDGVALKNLPPHKRAQKGLFLGFQQPVDIPGVTLAHFLRTAKNIQARTAREEQLSPTAFATSFKEILRTLAMDGRFGGRQVNAGLSGGEKKRSELLQMVVLKPRYALLDECDSGLDVDAVREVCRVIAEEAKKGVGFLLVSHNPALADLLPIDAVHVMRSGKIVANGGRDILARITEKGYADTN
ncbi:MAG: Fe-S cluster assembly ATPase SufC [Patescibacteria group bacterium]